MSDERKDWPATPKGMDIKIWIDEQGLVTISDMPAEMLPMVEELGTLRQRRYEMCG